MKEKKDIVIVARQGYQVLLNVGSQNFNVTCHEPLNLSRLFDEKTINDCNSLRYHLEDGNLVYYKGQALSKDPNSPEIQSMREVAETKIETLYNQEELTAASNVELSTTAGEITPELQKDIQTRVEKNREGILTQDKKLLARTKTPATNLAQGKERKTSLSKDELSMKISMDVSPEKFAEIQKNSRKNLQDQATDDHERAAKEIADLQKDKQTKQQEDE